MQAQKAVQELHKLAFLNEEIIVLPLKEDFVWGFQRALNGTSNSRFFYEHETSASDVFKPLLEGRRMLFTVGRGEPNTPVGEIVKGILEELTGKYDIEAVSAVSRFYDNKEEVPRMMCFLDFKTKSAADEAVRSIHDTEIQERRVLLQPSALSSSRSYHVGKVDQALLAELQEKGLASKEPFDSQLLKGKKNDKTTKVLPSQNKKAEGKVGEDAE